MNSRPSACKADVITTRLLELSPNADPAVRPFVITIVPCSEFCFPWDRRGGARRGAEEEKKNKEQKANTKRSTPCGDRTRGQSIKSRTLCLTELMRQGLTVLQVTTGFNHWALSFAVFGFRRGGAPLLQKKGGDTGIEPATSCTRSRNHTTRPITLSTI